MFITDESLTHGTWQAFERAVCRLLLYQGYDGIRLVGQTADKGADILAHKFGRRWLFQIKHLKTSVGVSVIDRTLDALQTYRAQIPVIVSLGGFDKGALAHQQVLLTRGIPLQLWNLSRLLELSNELKGSHENSHIPPKEYQKFPIQQIVQRFEISPDRRALIVMATGLGKTFVASEAIRRICSLRPCRVLVIAHTNPLVYQLEKAFWRFLSVDQETVIWNGYEQLTSRALNGAQFVFACVDSVAAYVEKQYELPTFDLVLIDECHHVGGKMYESVLNETGAGKDSGPFLIGLTATPWRPDETDLAEYFGKPLVSIDMVTGLREGFLANVDYRMYTDNIDWSGIQKLKGNKFTPRQINRTLFITEWDDAVVFEFQKAWNSQKNPRAIVFCGTIDHAITMRDRINSLGFCNAAAIYSQANFGPTMKAYERNRILSDFYDGTVNVVCAVDIFNEGVDVPDVNIIVFQRVTHSRRIFIQQLGRGLRVSPDKDKVIVLDFVSDIRRFAAGLDLKNTLGDDGPSPGKPVRIRLPNKVSFNRVDGEDSRGESFLRQWLDDVAAIEDAGEDASVLKFPPLLPGGKL